MPKVSQYYFKTAVVFLIVGIVMGLQMSMSGNHNVVGAHAHSNLIGWVTMALFGSYFALAPARAEGRLAMIQYCIYTVGVVITIPSLYFMMMGNAALEPIVAIGSLIAFAGVILFAFMVFSSAPSASTQETVPQN